MHYAQPWNFAGFENLDDSDMARVKINVGTGGNEVEDYTLNLENTVSSEDGMWYVSDLDVNQPLNIMVRENPTTGFSWHIGDLGNCIKVSDDNYQVDEAGRGPDAMATGVGGIRTIRFEPVGEVGCSEVIRMVYERPWQYKGMASVPESRQTRIKVDVVNKFLSP